MDKQTQIAANHSQHDKWGKALEMGFVVIPNALLRCQHKLGINDGEMVVLLNLMMSWWKVGEHPFPRAETMAKRMGVSDRTVQRHLGQLEKKRLISRMRRVDRRDDSPASVQYDLGGIVNALKGYGSEISRPQAALPSTNTNNYEVTQ